MSRRGGTPKRMVTPDPIYKSTVVTKHINQIMLDASAELRSVSAMMHLR